MNTPLNLLGVKLFLAKLNRKFHGISIKFRRKNNNLCMSPKRKQGGIGLKVSHKYIWDGDKSRAQKFIFSVDRGRPERSSETLD